MLRLVALRLAGGRDAPPLLVFAGGFAWRFASLLPYRRSSCRRSCMRVQARASRAFPYALGNNACIFCARQDVSRAGRTSSAHSAWHARRGTLAYDFAYFIWRERWHHYCLATRLSFWLLCASVLAAGRWKAAPPVLQRLAFCREQQAFCLLKVKARLLRTVFLAAARARCVAWWLLRTQR